MKRSELKVGDVLYYARPYEWDRDLLGDRVVILIWLAGGGEVLRHGYGNQS